MCLISYASCIYEKENSELPLVLCRIIMSLEGAVFCDYVELSVMLSIYFKSFSDKYSTKICST